MPLEKDIQRSIVEYLKLIGAVVVRVNSGGMTVRGKKRKRYVRFNDTNDDDSCPDLLICYRGRFGAIEVKRLGHTTAKKRMQKQERFIERIIASGGFGGVCYNIEDVANLIEESFNVGENA